ncbi:Secondary metabolism regulator LAE1 [Fusarium oxysporum f. sp. albedinis]|nr:Secondary metabolism regulator LAE1 [Fusarium oxysporum f. sp. albedinis]
MMRREDMLVAPFASAAAPRCNHQFVLSPAPPPSFFHFNPNLLLISIFEWNTLAEPNYLFSYFNCLTY